MKIAVVGSRDIHDYYMVDKAITDALRLWADGLSTTIVSGGATGVDALAKEWVLQEGLAAGAAPLPPLYYKEFLADWDKHGKAAGPMRNEQIAQYADMCVAVWDTQSRGTKDCIERFLRLGKPVLIYPVLKRTPLHG